jgi:hypothetical protein
MSTINKPYTFSPNTTASSSQVNANFDTLYNDYNGGISAANLAANSVSTAKIPDSAVTTPKLADGSVTNAKLAANTAWTTWTPTLVSLSGGTLTFAKYQQIGKTVHFRFMYTLAGAGVGSNPSFTLPVAATSDYKPASLDGPMAFSASYNDSSSNTVSPLTVFMSSASVVRLLAPTTGGTYEGVANVTATVPITWATGDYIYCSGTYEAE